VQISIRVLAPVGAFFFLAACDKDGHRKKWKGKPHMVTEIAQIEVKPGTEKDFEAAVAKAKPLFLRAKGGKGMELHKSVEKPTRYRLFVKWETLENHTVDFRGSEDFQAWRGLVGQYFASAPEVEHTETVVS
jgi:heme-degrading monooxygenase HmoA